MMSLGSMMRARCVPAWLAAVLSAGVFVAAVHAASPKPIELDPNYNHDLYGTMPRDIVRNFRAYTVSFDGADDDNGDGKPDKWAIPHWVAYEIKALPDPGQAPPRPDWFTDLELYAEGIAPVDESYHFRSKWSAAYPASEQEGYDRGHMCRKSHAWRLGANADWNTHTLLNACPQQEDLNQGIWQDLEDKTVAWANTYGSVWIITGPVVFNRQPSKWLGQPGEVPVAIPDAFFKIVVRQDAAGELAVLAFLYPQTGINYKHAGQYDHAPYLTSVDIIEALTGLDFLTNVPDEAEAKLERVIHTELWS